MTPPRKPNTSGPNSGQKPKGKPRTGNGPKGPKGQHTNKPKGARPGSNQNGKPGGNHRGGQKPQGERPPRKMDPRRAAHRLVCAVLEDGETLADLIGLNGPLATLEPGDRARAQRLATETLRNLDPLDDMLAQFVERAPAEPVLNVMRIAAYELAHGEAAYGVVNAAVTQIAAMPRHNRAKGMANAVLRKVADIAADAWANRAPTQLPLWLREPLIMAWGKEAVKAFEAVHAKGAPLDITPRSADLAEPLAKQLDAVILPSGSLRIDRSVQVSALPGFESGTWWVQDAAAAIPARLLNAKPGEKVLDLCAAPGGKTLQLAAAGAEVTALDISPARTERVSENLARTGLKAQIVTMDALEYTTDGWDAILLDAPCSATGTIRRHPDLPYAQDGSGITELIELQSRMIDHALSLLKPGGRLVFCTCSLIPDECEVQVDQALARHQGLTADKSCLELAGIDPAWITQEGGVRLRPDFWAEQGGMDGFYCAVLCKPR